MRKQALNSINDLIKKNSNFLFIGSDLGSGLLDDVNKDLQSQYFMEGVSEQYLIGLSAGLALEGFRPFINTIGSFLVKRCYEQIYIDLCLHNLPVTLIANGGGAVYAPLGPTHLNLDDFSLLRTLPNMHIFSPADAFEMNKIINLSQFINSPVYIRVGRGGEKIVSNLISKNKNILKAIQYVNSSDYNIFTTGSMLQCALDVSNEFKKIGIDLGIIHIPCLKPIDKKTIIEVINRSKKVFILEEHYINGGLGSIILETVCKNSSSTEIGKIKLFGIANKFFNRYGSQKELLKYWGLDKKSIFYKIKKCI